MFCVYGAPPAELAVVPPGAVQVSPLSPGAQALEALEPEGLAGAVVAAPPGVVERRYVLARLLQSLAPGAPLTALAPKDKGGARLRKELEGFGAAVVESGRRHQRICQTVRHERPIGLERCSTNPRFWEPGSTQTQPFSTVASLSANQSVR